MEDTKGPLESTWAKIYILTLIPRSTRFPHPSLLQFPESCFIICLFLWPHPFPSGSCIKENWLKYDLLANSQKFLSYGFLLIISAEFPLIIKKLHCQHTQ